MADKRMLTKKITDADEFISMPSSAQALYLHLNQSADDDGFNNQVQMAMFKAHASVDDVKILLAKRYIIQFESGVIVIKHWRMSNALRKDRYTPTAFQEELKMLKLKDNGSYTLNEDGLPDGCQVVATDKDSIGKDSIGKVSIGKERTNAHALASDFDKLWNIYPKKKGKKTAFTAYERAIKKGVSNDVIEKAIYAFIADCKRNNTADRYIPYGGTWFNQERWNDSYDSAGIAVENYDGGENILDELGDF